MGAVELEADEIGPSLRYATASVNKVSRSGGASDFTGGSVDPWASTPPAKASAGYDEEPPF